MTIFTIVTILIIIGYLVGSRVFLAEFLYTRYMQEYELHLKDEETKKVNAEFGHLRSKLTFDYQEGMTILDDVITRRYEHYFLGSEYVENIKILGSYEKEMTAISVQIASSLSPEWYERMTQFISRDYIEHYIAETVQLMTIKLAKEKRIVVVPPSRTHIVKSSRRNEIHVI